MLQHVGQTMPKKEIVAQDERAARASDEVAADDEGVRQSSRLLLGRVVESKAPPASIAKKIAELRLILWSGDDEDVANARQHEGAQRVVDHRLVVDGQKLLGRDKRYWIETRTLSAG